MIELTETNVIILLMIVLVIFLICYTQFKNNHVNNNVNNNQLDTFSLDNEEINQKSKKQKSTKKKKNNSKFDMNEVMNVIDKSKKKHKKKHKIKHDEFAVNSEFIEMQYHKDYNDVITAINNLTPQKELFNLGFKPVVNSKPNHENVKSLVELFVNKINYEIEHNVQEYLHTNSGWNDMGKRKREKTGIEKILEDELGLPGSLYTEPAGNAPIKLIKIDRAEQFTTDDQIRFIIYIIIQKENVKDQMVLQVQFFMEREDLSGTRDDRADFFTKGLLREGDNEKIDPDQVAIIEQVFTLGYLTDAAEKKTKMDRFHDYGNVQHSDGTIDQEKVIKMMLIKHKERENELNSFLNTVDNDTKEIHNVPGLDMYSQYKNTRTIMDDLAQFPQKSFGDITI